MQFGNLGRKAQKGTHSSCPNETDQLGDVDQTDSKDRKEGLCVEVRYWVVGFRVAIVGVVLVGL